MNIILTILAFIFGAIIGSFLNVVILRHSANIKKTRSFCFSCGHILKPIDLVPIFSFLFLGGKCRYCKSKISSQYFWVELAFAITSVILLFTVMDSSNLNSSLSNLSLYFMAKYLVILAFFALLTCTFVYDLKHKIMPDSWTLSAFILALIYSTLFAPLSGLSFIVGLKWALIGAVLVGIPLLLINLISRGRAMGMGDVKFAPIMGALLGVSAGFASLMISFWIGGIVGVYLLIRSKILFKILSKKSVINNNKKITAKSEIPFGPFLVLATFVVFVLGINIDTILVWLSKIL